MESLNMAASLRFCCSDLRCPFIASRRPIYFSGLLKNRFPSPLTMSAMWG